MRELKEKDTDIYRTKREHQELITQIEEDADNEICEIKDKYTRRLREKEEYIMQLKGENAIKERKYNYLQREIKNHQQEKN